MNDDETRAQLDTLRRQQEDRLAHAIHYGGAGRPAINQPGQGLAPSGQVIQNNTFKTNVKDFMAYMLEQRDQRARTILNVPPAVDSYHRLAWSRQINPTNESASYNGIYGN